MLTKLPQGAFERVRPLFAPIAYNLVINATLSGLSPGPVFVDNTADPHLVLAQANSRLFLGGYGDEAFVPDLRQFFLDRFYPQAAESDLQGYTLHYLPGWEAYIDKILDGKHPMCSIRHHYSLDANSWTLASQPPAGYELHPVDATLLARSDLEHMDVVIEEMQSERPSVEEFLAKSFGFCAIKDGAIVAWCMSEYNCGGRCEIGIWTLEEHRRRGLAVATASAVVDRAITEGITTVGWHCWASNAPSIATALKLGFTLVTRYPVYFAYFNRQMNLAVNGNMSLHAGNAQQAMKWFEEAEALGELPAWANEQMVEARKIIISKADTS
ncbi:MAG: GNAT family N-acetyltransferase [Chloroflexi bacterium]|jgi:RimJ/RimL family protein N-acetyltransferase|nr:GNAT family N-acetyltransferase [Chloroflexota bacterium]